MKNKFFLILLVCVISLMVSCSDNNVHTHEFGNEWVTDGERHWHVCSGCEEVSDEAYHILVEGEPITEGIACTESLRREDTCSTCGYKVVVELDENGNVHNWDEGVITKEETCKADGVKKYTCPDCGASKTEPIPMTCKWDEGVTLNEATCTNPGSVRYMCTRCFATKIEATSLAHTGKFENGKWSCCNSTMEEPISVDRWNNGGWENRDNEWIYLAKNLEGDYTVTATYHIETNSIQGNWWRGVGVVVQEATPNLKGSVWVTRMDWWGWCDIWPDSTEKLTEQFNHQNNAIVGGDSVRDVNWTNTANGMDVTGAQYESAMTSSTITLVATRVGNVITNSFTIKAADGTYTYWSKVTDVKAEKSINIALYSEFVKYTLYSVVVE